MKDLPRGLVLTGKGAASFYRIGAHAVAKLPHLHGSPLAPVPSLHQVECRHPPGPCPPPAPTLSTGP